MPRKPVVTQDNKVPGSYEDRQDVLRDAIRKSYPDETYVYLVSTTDTTVAYEVDSGPSCGTYQSDYTIDAKNNVTLSPPKAVKLTRTVTVVEQGRPLTAVLTLEAGREVELLQAGEDSPDGSIRVRVPFYVGNSQSKAPGFKKDIYWPESTLAGIVQSATDEIRAAAQPLTVYARHAHATGLTHLPIGTVVSVEQDGRTGYATLEILPTEPDGKNVQMLVQHKALNAVSLRSTRFQLKDGTVNSQPMLICEGMSIDGIDFAPNGPAQPTYGIEILNQEAIIEVDAPKPKEGSTKKVPDEIKLEDVPADIREQIEAPLRSQLEKITGERDTLVQEKALASRDTYLREIASKADDAEEGFKTLVALCDKHNARTAEAAAPHVTPFLLQALEAARTQTKVAPEETVEQRAAKLFGGGTSAGRGVVDAGTTPVVTQETLGETTIGGLALPGGF